MESSLVRVRRRRLGVVVLRLSRLTSSTSACRNVIHHRIHVSLIHPVHESAITYGQIVVDHSSQVWLALIRSMKVAEIDDVPTGTRYQ
jgi:hypothetical protein